ncbi:MAG TPA: hypothetical protein VMD59_15240, partial [Acidimicrobiales bacterium]|nr:hypothetical protein [Acidimicrobiales bacterium]
MGAPVDVVARVARAAGGSPPCPAEPFAAEPFAPAPFAAEPFAPAPFAAEPFAPAPFAAALGAAVGRT